MSPGAGPAGPECQTAPAAVASGLEDGGEDAPAGQGAAVPVGCRRARAAPGPDGARAGAWRGAAPREATHHLRPRPPQSTTRSGDVKPPSSRRFPGTPDCTAPSPSAPRDPSGGAGRRRSPRSSRRRDGAGGKCGRRGPGGCAATAATGRALWWRRLTRRGEAVPGAAAPSRRPALGARSPPGVRSAGPVRARPVSRSARRLGPRSL